MCGGGRHGTERGLRRDGKAERLKASGPKGAEEKALEKQKEGAVPYDGSMS